MPGIFTPLTDKPRKVANRIADKVDPRTRDTSKESIFDVMNRALIAGMIQGVGNEVSGMTSPAGIAATALPMLRGARGAGALFRGVKPPAPTVTPPPNVISSPDMVPIGGENIYNIIRMAEGSQKMKGVKEVADVAEDAYRANQGGIRPGLGDVDIVEIMQRVAKARGK